MQNQPLRVVLIKPSKYDRAGWVERWEKGFMPNATLYHIRALSPKMLNGASVNVELIDEYVHTDLHYLKSLVPEPGITTVVALVGIQSHQFHRALDIAALVHERGIEHCILGGPHPMTCDTSFLAGTGISVAVAEGERVWREILTHAQAGRIAPHYGDAQRWETRLADVVIEPPEPAALSHYWAPMLGLYPVRGCPYRCNYCSVIKISGRAVRHQSVGATLESLQRAKAVGVDTVMFVSDNFNKYPLANELLEAIAEAKLGLRLFCQCDTQLAKQEDLVEALGRAGCFEVFLGVESFDRETLKAAHKYHNQPKLYAQIVAMLRERGIRTHFSNILGFPQDTLASVSEHVEALKALSPEVVSFYILTPIPGTEQYDEYLEQGLIWETNLDRFDGTSSTWRHPRLSAEQLEDALYGAYFDYYTHLLRTHPLTPEGRNIALLSRAAARDRVHPMGGGIRPIHLDRVEEYLERRKRYFGFEHAPLPASLTLSETDRAINARAKWQRAVV